MNASEVRGNEGDLGVHEVWNEAGGEGVDTGQWNGEFDGIRSDVDFRRALAIEESPVQGSRSLKQQQQSARAQVSTKSKASAATLGSPMVVRALKALRAMGETLSAWRAIRVPMR